MSNSVPSLPSPTTAVHGAPRGVGLFRGLAFKQAAATLAIALVVGLAASAYELWADYRAMRTQTVQRQEANMGLVRGLAVEAAFQLSNDLAGEVVAGLAQDDMVHHAQLTDNFGTTLGRKQRAMVSTPLPGVAQVLFGDMVVFQTTLENRGADGLYSIVGVLDLRLDPGRMMNAWLDRGMSTMVTGAVRTILLCILVVAVFYAMITKPILGIAAGIARIDPARPGANPLSIPTGHRTDELGLLAAALNRLLDQSQAGLDGRDRAEQELAALARDLEQRVEQRTAELEREKAGVERALVQLNQANSELERAHRHINDSIRYASRIQTALLPDSLSLDGLVDEFAVGWQPLDLVGGDYYWAGQVGGKVVIAVMDCTGHGVPGAFMTAVVASSFSRILNYEGHDDPAQMLGALNRLVRSALRQDRESALSNDGLDAGICVIDPAQNCVSFAGANLSLLMQDGQDLALVRGNRMSLGYLDSPADYVFTTHRFAIAKGAAFYLFTDGVTDQVGGPLRRLYGRKRLETVLAKVAHQPLQTQMEALFAELSEWRGPERRRDDTTFLAFRPRI